MASKNAINSNIPIEVSLGGTGNISLTQYSPLIGQGTSPISTITPGTDGQVLIAATGADPAFASLTSTGSSITYTPGAASLAATIANGVATSAWTPTIAFGGGSTGITYAFRFARYARWGNLVFLYTGITLSNKGTDVGVMTLNTLPVTVAAGKSFAMNVILANGVYTGQVTAIASGTSVSFYDSASGGAAAQLTDASFVNTSTVFCVGYYFA
jgi:hypothetical protein